MERIFISSLARGEMGDIRASARAAVESLDMRPVMFETQPATAQDARRALLDEVATCDALILLVGAEYGEPGQRGMSPTEEEFNEARERGIDVLALVQDVRGREPAQQDFLARVRGGWEQGNFTSLFTGPGDVALAVVRTLNAWQRSLTGGDSTAARTERALKLARGPERQGMLYGGSMLRVVAAPVLARPLIDAVALRNADELLESLASAARASRLVSQAMAIETSVGRDSLHLSAQGSRGGETQHLIVGFDGAVVGEGSVAGDQIGFGGMVVLAHRVREVMERTAAFAEQAWQLIDSRDELRQVLLVAAVPEAEHKTYADVEPGSSLSMPMSMPHTLIAPEQPITVRRADLSRTATIDRLQAELRRAFEVAGAVQETRG
jgi:hypothetical protein